MFVLLGLLNQMKIKCTYILNIDRYVFSDATVHLLYRRNNYLLQVPSNNIRRNEKCAMARMIFEELVRNI